MNNEEEFNEESEGFKEWLQKVASESGRNAAIRFKANMGYVVYVKDGWIIKEYDDGRVEKIEAVEEFDKDGSLVRQWLDKINKQNK